MHEKSRDPSNVYWSWRRHLKAELSTTRIYYNPGSQPKPTDVNQWLIFWIGPYRAQRWVESTPRLICVQRFDETNEDMMDFVDDVLAAVDRQGNSVKQIDFYHKPTATIIGTIDVINVAVGPTMEYATGIDSIAIDVYTRVKTDRNV